MRVDVELLAGLGVLHEKRADIGQLDFPPVEQPDGHHLVALGQQVQRALPSGSADEVGDHEDQRPALDGLPTGVEQRARDR